MWSSELTCVLLTARIQSSAHHECLSLFLATQRKSEESLAKAIISRTPQFTALILWRNVPFAFFSRQSSLLQRDFCSTVWYPAKLDVSLNTVRCFSVQQCRTENGTQATRESRVALDSFCVGILCAQNSRFNCARCRIYAGARFSTALSESPA